MPSTNNNRQTRFLDQSGKNFKNTKKFAQLLLRVTNDMAATKSLDEALETLVKITTTTIGADRGTIFLHDRQTNELYSQVTYGGLTREIRIMSDVGIAGHVFKTQERLIVRDVYQDERFNTDIDRKTGYHTQNLLCVPLTSIDGEHLGAAQILNKEEGEFTEDDLDLLEAMTRQAAIVIQGNLVILRMEEARRQELEFLDVVTKVATELNLSVLLQNIIRTITVMLDAERSTLFINDERTQELYTEVGEGLGKTQIRFPNHLGIAGTVFTTQKSINIPYAYADLRFNPSFDKQTGFFTRSILCCPVFNKAGKVIGVTQVLNKRGGTFTSEDETRLGAFTSQISMGIENAKLFDDIQNMKNYNESMLESMSNAVITLNEEENIVTCNAAGQRILKIDNLNDVLGKSLEAFFGEHNQWVIDRIRRIGESSGERTDDVVMDAELTIAGETISANVTILPLVNTAQKRLGHMIVIEDISNEKRMKSTMSRYMDSGLADKLMAGGDDILGGVSSIATILFSDIRSFTSLTEEVGAEGTVTLLNEYFSRMVDCIQAQGGMLDKFIGDAIMAVFGTPFPHEDDPDRALRAAIAMMNELEILNERRQKRGHRLIQHGIGLNTDNVVSGNIGSPKRMDYTVIGDGVNLAARLESACKQYSAKILISEYTFNQLKSTYRTRVVDKVIVKGKTRPVSVYEVMDHYTPESFPNMIEVLEYFSNGMECYKAAKWELAINMFSKAVELNPDDICSQMYVQRCRELQDNPPKDQWDGVWIMKTK